MFLNFYEKLQPVLPVQDLSPQLVRARIITTTDQLQIIKMTRDDEKAVLVLDKIANLLKAGYKHYFYELLDMMKKHQTEAVSDLSDKICKEICK